MYVEALDEIRCRMKRADFINIWHTAWKYVANKKQ